MIDSASAPDSPYAWLRLAASMLVATIACVGMWSVVVVLPLVQREFGTARAEASLPYTAMMLGFAAGTMLMGRIADRHGMVVPIVLAAVLLAAGYVAAGLAPGLTAFALAHGLLIGVGAAAGFAPLMADISHWFVARRGLAVVLAASGNYIAGALWPLVLNEALPAMGWRNAHFAIAAFVLFALLPLAPVFARRVSRGVLARAEEATAKARASLGVSANTLQAILCVAGFSCCMAMSMPQVHLVAYCGDLGYGVARGAEMLSLMLALGIVSRIGSGFLADRIGGGATLLVGSFMQMAALALYTWFDGLTSLYVISGIFGLFQGGIVPMYAVIIRDYLPPREAGARIGIVITATILGMAFGGYAAGWIFDHFASYRMAFLDGIAWNGVNLALVAWLLLRRRAAMAPA